MDDLLIFIIALFCGNITDANPNGQAADAVLLALFNGAGQSTVSCVDQDERVGADYPRLIIAGAEGDQAQSGDGNAKFFEGDVKLEIVTRSSDAVPDELDLLDNIKARCTDLLLGSEKNTLPPMQGRSFTVSGRSYNVSVFCQRRPTGRLPAEDPTIKRWAGSYRVKLCRLGY